MADLKKVARSIGLNGTEQYGKLRWSKRGGHAGDKVISRVRKAAEAAGWKRGESKSSNNPTGDVVSNSADLISPDGQWKLSWNSRYGVEARDNSYSLELSPAGMNEDGYEKMGKPTKGLEKKTAARNAKAATRPCSACGAPMTSVGTCSDCGYPPNFCNCKKQNEVTKELRRYVSEWMGIKESNTLAFWHKKMPRPSDDPKWEHEKMRIQSMSDKALEARIYKIGSPKKLYLFASALKDEGLTYITNIAYSQLEKMKMTEWMGGFVGTPNFNSMCDKCDMPRNACTCNHEEELEKNQKAKLPKGIKFMGEKITRSTVRRVIEQIVQEEKSKSEFSKSDIAKMFQGGLITQAEYTKALKTGELPPDVPGATYEDNSKAFAGAHKKGQTYRADPITGKASPLKGHDWYNRYRDDLAKRIAAEKATQQGPVPTESAKRSSPDEIKPGDTVIYSGNPNYRFGRDNGKEFKVRKLTRFQGEPALVLEPDGEIAYKSNFHLKNVAEGGPGSGPQKDGSKEKSIDINDERAVADAIDQHMNSDEFNDFVNGLDLDANNLDDFQNLAVDFVEKTLKVSRNDPKFDKLVDKATDSFSDTDVLGDRMEEVTLGEMINKITEGWANKGKRVIFLGNDLKGHFPGVITKIDADPAYGGYIMYTVKLDNGKTVEVTNQFLEPK